MAFITITDDDSGTRTAVNLDNVRAVVDKGEKPVIVMVASGPLNYSITARESFEEVLSLVGQVTRKAG